MSASSVPANLGIDPARLMGRLQSLGQVGALPGGGVCRLALTDADRQGRELVVGWMKDLGLAVTVDSIGNVFGLRRGVEDGPPVVIGSHIDTVATGGLYDGALGVLTGLEVVNVLNDAAIRTRRPLAVAFFTNEEGARFHPDMLGSAVLSGRLDLAEVLATVGIDGATLGDELRASAMPATPGRRHRRSLLFRITHRAGPGPRCREIASAPSPGCRASAGPITLQGPDQSRRHHANGHAPRRRLCRRPSRVEAAGGARNRRAQVATVGRFGVTPGLTNVVPGEALVTTDLRNTDGAALAAADARLQAFAAEVAAAEGVALETRALARFEPVAFDPALVGLVEETARGLGHTVKRMPSGAGHDAQMFAPSCPTAMIFVPSKGGISHNVTEHTEPADIAAGAEVLLRVALEKAGVA